MGGITDFLIVCDGTINDIDSEEFLCSVFIKPVHAIVKEKKMSLVAKEKEMIDRLRSAHAAIKKAQEIADENGFAFHEYYGAGSYKGAITYDKALKLVEDHANEWNQLSGETKDHIESVIDRARDFDDGDNYDEGGWRTSFC